MIKIFCAFAVITFSAALVLAEPDLEVDNIELDQVMGAAIRNCRMTCPAREERYEYLTLRHRCFMEGMLYRKVAMANMVRDDTGFARLIWKTCREALLDKETTLLAKYRTTR